MTQSTPSSNLYRDEFGFDPPTSQLENPTYELPINHALISLKPTRHSHRGEEHSSIQNIRTPASNNVGCTWFDSLPEPSSRVLRYGQITPPRSDSAGSAQSLKTSEEGVWKVPMSHKMRKKADAETMTRATSDHFTTPRTRHRSTKPTTSFACPATSPNKEKREISLEKNKVAAAKCRIKNKQRVAKLQKQSQELTTTNTVLKQTIKEMMVDIQQLQLIWASHMTNAGCQMPEEIPQTLNRLESPDCWDDTRLHDYDEHESMLELHHNEDLGLQLELLPSWPSSPSPSMVTLSPLPNLDIVGEYEVTTSMQDS